MTTPTVPVTVNLAAMGGPALPNITVIASLDSNEVYNGVVVAMKVSAKTDNTGVAVLNLFPNAPAPTGLGTLGTTYRITATIPGGRSLNVDARVPNSACRLENILVLEQVGPLSAAELALLQAQSSLSEVSANAAAADAARIAAQGAAGTATTKASEAAGSKSGADAAAAAAGASASAAGAAATAAAGSATAADAARIAAEAALAAGGAGIDPDSLSDVASLTGAERIATKQGGNMRGLDVNVLKDYLLNGGKDAAFNLAQAISATFGTKYGYTASIGVGGGKVTQANSKTQAVTLNCAAGQVTLNAASLAAGAQVAFTLNNTSIAADDEVYVWKKGGGTAGAYNVEVDSVAAGSCSILVKNTSGGALAEALIIGFSVRSAAITPVLGNGGGAVMMIGMNIGTPGDYSVNRPFANLFNTARPWKRQDDGSQSFWPSQNQHEITGATGTMRFSAVIIDPASGIASQTLRVLNPGGNTIGYNGSETAAPGTMVTTAAFDITYTAGSPLCLHVMGNTTGRIAVLIEGHETSFLAGNEWNNALITYHQGLKTKVVRFMDVGNANGSVEEVWSDRTLPGKTSYRSNAMGGAPWEARIDLANRLNADLYINIPARASNAYVLSLVALIYANLNPGLNCWIEWGNEIWNIFALFATNTNWITFLGHTRFALTPSAIGVFQKTAHGYANNTVLRSFIGKVAYAAGADTEVKLSDTPWATATVYSVDQIRIGPDGEMYLCKTAHTSGTFATDVAAGKWEMCAWWPACYGNPLYTQSVDADHIKLYEGPGATGRRVVFPPTVASTLAIRETEIAVPDMLTAMNTNYGTLAKSAFDAADAAFGGTARVKPVIAAQASYPAAHTAQRLAVTGVAARAPYLAIAPYHGGGYYWGGAVIPKAGAVFTPRFWTSHGGGDDPTPNFYYSIYTAGATPTPTERKAGTGALRFQGPTPVNYTPGGYVNGTDTAALTVGVSYDHYIGYIDIDGFTHEVKQTITASSTLQPQVDFLDTYANQQRRDFWGFDKPSSTGVFAAILAHKALAVAANPAIKMINYESGSHQDRLPPAAINTWMAGYFRSATYGSGTLKRYEEGMAACGTVLDLHYMDCFGTTTTNNPFTLSDGYTDITSTRYVGMASFNGEVPVRTLVDSGNLTGTNFPTAPTYPAVVKTFPDATLTYELVNKGGATDNGNFSITGNVLSLINGTGINYAALTSWDVWIHATDGHTDAFFPVQFTTGDAWYSGADKLAWSYLDDSTPAAMNPAIGNSQAPNATPATLVANGWDMVGAATYEGGLATGSLAYTDSPLFAVVGCSDDNAASFKEFGRFGGGADNVQFVTFTGPARLAVTWTGSTGGATVNATHAFNASTLEVHWVWIDNANLKVYTGINLTEDVVGGTSFVSQGAATFSNFVRLGGDSSAVLAGVKSGPAVGTLAQAKALIQKIMTKHGI